MTVAEYVGVHVPWCCWRCSVDRGHWLSADDDAWPHEHVAALAAQCAECSK